MSLKLEVGKCYVRRDGAIVGPVKRFGSGPYPYAAESFTYTLSGHRFRGRRHSTDLVKEYKPKSKASKVAYSSPIQFEAAHQHLTALGEVHAELNKAMNSFPAFNTAHEGYAVLLEEVDELWSEIKKKQGSSGRPEAIRKEAVQVAAMALRLILDTTDPTKPAYNK